MQLGEREAGPAAAVGQLGEEREVAAGRLGPALQDVAGHGRPGQGVQIDRVQPKRWMAGPTTSEASVTRPVTTTSRRRAGTRRCRTRPGTRWR